MEILPSARENAGQTENLSLKKAIKDYRDKYLSGLTEEERKEIEAKLAAFRKKCVEDGMDPKAIRDAIDQYYRSLLKQYGAKFDPLLDNADGEADGMKTQATGKAAEAVVKTTTTSADNNSNSTQPTTQSTTQTDADGTVYLLVTTPNGVVMRIALANGTPANNPGGEDNSFPSKKAIQAYEDMSLIS